MFNSFELVSTYFTGQHNFVVMSRIYCVSFTHLVWAYYFFIDISYFGPLMILQKPILLALDLLHKFHYVEDLLLTWFGSCISRIYYVLVAKNDMCCVAPRFLSIAESRSGAVLQIWGRPSIAIRAKIAMYANLPPLAYSAMFSIFLNLFGTTFVVNPPKLKNGCDNSLMQLFKIS